MAWLLLIKQPIFLCFSGLFHKPSYTTQSYIAHLVSFLDIHNIYDLHFTPKKLTKKSLAHKCVQGIFLIHYFIAFLQQSDIT